MALIWYSYLCLGGTTHGTAEQAGQASGSGGALSVAHSGGTAVSCTIAGRVRLVSLCGGGACRDGKHDNVGEHVCALIQSVAATVVSGFYRWPWALINACARVSFCVTRASLRAFSLVFPSALLICYALNLHIWRKVQVLVLNLTVECFSRIPPLATTPLGRFRTYG